MELRPFEEGECYATDLDSSVLPVCENDYNDEKPEPCGEIQEGCLLGSICDEDAYGGPKCRCPDGLEGDQCRIEHGYRVKKQVPDEIQIGRKNAIIEGKDPQTNLVSSFGG